MQALNTKAVVRKSFQNEEIRWKSETKTLSDGLKDKNAIALASSAGNCVDSSSTATGQFSSDLFSDKKEVPNCAAPRERTFT